MDLRWRQLILAGGQLKLVREREVADRGVVGVERHAHLLVEEFLEWMLRERRNAARLQVARQANLNNCTPVAHLFE